MRLRARLGVTLWRALLGAAFFATSAHAQFSASGGAGDGGSGYMPGTGSMFSSASDSSPLARLNKTKRGRDLREWIRWLGDKNPSRRLEAVKSLGDSNDPAAIDYLVQAVGDPDPRVEAKAVDYLGKLHAADSTQFLIQKLFMVGTKTELRHRIVMTLGKIGDPRASHPILQYVQGEDDHDVRAAGIYAIGEIGDVSVREDLSRFTEIEEDPSLKSLAHEALTKITTRQPPPTQKDPSAFPTALEAALSTER